MLAISKSKKLWLNSVQDLMEAWSLLKDGGRLTFWCNGVQKEDRMEESRKRASNSEADGPTKKKRGSSEGKAEQVTEMKAELKEIHGMKFNELQYRMWAEVLVSGAYSDTQNPPPYPMFGKARQTKSAVNQSTTANPGPANLTLSPGTRAIELRGKCIEQIKEIISLRDIGALSEEELKEKDCIM